MKALTRKEWAIAFVLPLAVGLILWAVSKIPAPTPGKRPLYYEIIVLNHVSPGRKEFAQLGEIKIFNFGDADVSNVELVVPNFGNRVSKLETGFGFNQAILAEPLTVSSVDGNGTLRIKYRKIFAKSEASIKFTGGNEIITPSAIQSPNDEIDMIPLAMVSPTQPAGSYMNIYVALPIIQIVLSICLFFVLKTAIRSPSKTSTEDDNNG